MRMTAKMRPFHSAPFLACLNHTVTPSTSAVVISLPRLPPILGDTYRFSDELQFFADVEPPPVREVGTYRGITLGDLLGRSETCARSRGYSCSTVRRPSNGLHPPRSSGGIIVDLLIVACEAMVPSASAPVPAIHPNRGVTVTWRRKACLQPLTTARSAVATSVTDPTGRPLAIRLPRRRFLSRSM